MKISHTDSAARLNAITPGSTRTNASGPTRAGAESSTHVKITHANGWLEAAGDASGDVDLDRVQQLSQALKDGTLRIDASRIARHLIDDAINLL